MKNTLNKIKEIIAVPMKEMDIIVAEIDFIKEHQNYFLKITLDKVNGIDLDTIVEATNIINPLLDEYDLIEEEYILDIASKERGK